MAAKKAAANSQSSGFLKPAPLSQAMRKFLGDSELSRGKAVKVWDHIKANNLQVINGRARLIPANGLSHPRRFGILNDFKDKLNGQIRSYPELQQSIKELKEKKENIATRMKQTSERLYDEVDGLWTETEDSAKKVSANVKEKISSATEEVKEKFGLGKQNSSTSSYSTDSSADTKDRRPVEDMGNSHASERPGTSETYYNKFKSSSSATFLKLKDTKIVDLAMKGFDIVKDELSSNPNKRRRMRNAAASATQPKESLSSRTDIVVVPGKQSPWGKKWEAFKDKMHAHPIFKKISGYSEPVVTKSQEIAEDMREHWETSDHPVVHKIQDLNESVFGETAAALSFKEIRRQDPSFSLPEFVAEVQEIVRPTLTAYLKCDIDTLKKHCSPELIERCRAERNAYASQGFFFDNRLLHISDVEIRETKLMGDSPIIIVAFQTQQIYCVRDREGSVMEGGKDTIHTVHYAWAMQLVDAEELGEGAFYPMWKLREMQQLGIQALI